MLNRLFPPETVVVISKILQGIRALLEIEIPGIGVQVSVDVNIMTTPVLSDADHDDRVKALLESRVVPARLLDVSPQQLVDFIAPIHDRDDSTTKRVINSSRCLSYRNALAAKLYGQVVQVSQLPDIPKHEPRSVQCSEVVKGIAHDADMRNQL